MPFDRDRAQDDITDYSAEAKAEAWEAHQILEETRAYVRAQMLRLAKASVLDQWTTQYRGIAQEPFRCRMSEEDTANFATRCVMDTITDALDGDVCRLIAEMQS